MINVKRRLIQVALRHSFPEEMGGAWIREGWQAGHEHSHWLTQGEIDIEGQWGAKWDRLPGGHILEERLGNRQSWKLDFM